MKAKELRKKSRLKRQCCSVCGRHIRISESHHLISLASASSYIGTGLENNIELKLNLPEICLCPNHHTYLHYFQKKQELYLLGNYLYYDTTIDELLAYARILQTMLEWFNTALDEACSLWGGR